MVNNKKADRARQFLPFDALKGYKEAIKERQKVIINKKDLSEDDASSLNYKLMQVNVGMMVKIVYYNDNQYEVIEGMVSKIDLDNKIIVIVKNKIDINNIINITSDEIKELETD